MFAIVFGPIFAIALNAHICAADPATPSSVIDAMKPGACPGREEVYKFNR